ncbi:hypothetical protein LBKG_02169 [Lactobacillus crispatus CTV-05]|uniref:hypothetical protein n=1 Tax=Lactobacillus crispatus TaxID=47770 RepID=UPI0001EC2B9E|nr:hypothetical protein [Lactobacillus crispatus]EFQ43516.1 hypothetical protein LBKG_02169 [Lactobacillus crispatus CTV-05]DAX60844.1 MAG TPA: hypothetical protein [Caudoviricetes sp.]
MKLPELLGSEKQVKWANDIRQEYIDQLAKDEKLVEKYLELKEKSDDGSKELKDLEWKIRASLFADMDQSRFGSFITPVMGADLADKQAFEDKVQDDTEGYLFADFSSKEEAEKCYEQVKQDYLKAGGQKVWNLSARYNEITDKYGFGVENEETDSAYQKWQKEAEKVMFNYLKIRWNDKITNEKSSAWYIEHRLNKKF